MSCFDVCWSHQSLVGHGYSLNPWYPSYLLKTEVFSFFSWPLGFPWLSSCWCRSVLAFVCWARWGWIVIVTHGDEHLDEEQEKLKKILAVLETVYQQILDINGVVCEVIICYGKPYGNICVSKLLHPMHPSSSSRVATESVNASSPPSKN